MSSSIGLVSGSCRRFCVCFTTAAVSLEEASSIDSLCGGISAFGLRGDTFEKTQQSECRVKDNKILGAGLVPVLLSISTPESASGRVWRQGWDGKGQGSHVGKASEVLVKSPTEREGREPRSTAEEAARPGPGARGPLGKRGTGSPGQEIDECVHWDLRSECDGIDCIWGCQEEDKKNLGRTLGRYPSVLQGRL